MSRQAKSPPLARMACLALTLALACLGGSLWACPFCNSIKMTLAEEIDQAEVAILAEVVDQPPAAVKIAADDADDLPLATADSAEAEFKIKKVLKGADALGKTRRIRTLYFGQQPKGTLFLILGVDPKNIAWSTPTALSERAADYVANLNELPPSGADRLDFFQKYFEDEDRILAEDAYEEFAKASYNDVKQLRERMDRAKLLDWIRDPNVAATRRRLYLTMLGICGTGQDADMLEAMLKGDDRRARTALDAMIACYVTLKGPAAMDVVDQLFFKDSKAEYTSSYSAIMAVRFLDQETEVVPRERLTQSLRHLLDRPQLADLVIPDLARWQDWSVMDKLVTLFKEATEENSWVRVPVINYLMACPHPEAKRHLDELGKIDPDAVKRASFFLPLAGSKRPTTEKPAEGGQDGAADAAADPKAENSEGTQEASEEKDNREQKAAGPTADDEQGDDEQAGVQEAGVEENLQSAAGDIPGAPHDIALAVSESGGQTTASGAGEAT
ncbi:MAG: hypothetical protein WD403_16780, partial [Pirellulales bacterium]